MKKVYLNGYFYMFWYKHSNMEDHAPVSLVRYDPSSSCRFHLMGTACTGTVQRVQVADENQDLARLARVLRV